MFFDVPKINIKFTDKFLYIFGHFLLACGPQVIYLPIDFNYFT